MWKHPARQNLDGERLRIRPAWKDGFLILGFFEGSLVSERGWLYPGSGVALVSWVPSIGSSDFCLCLGLHDRQCPLCTYLNTLF